MGLAAALVALPACGSADAGGGGTTSSATGGGTGLAAISGKFQGRYEVPVPDALAAAATYPVEDVAWSVEGGIARLRYDLPEALVGAKVRVEFEGPVDSGAPTASLTGEAGTADCVAGATGLSCHEVMTGLLPMSPDYDLIRALAEAGYPGPAADRLEVAQRFAADPIGIVHVDVDVDAGAPED